MTQEQPTTLPNDITEAVSISNVSTIAGQPAVLSNLALGNLIQNINMSQQNAITHQQSMNEIQATVLAKVINVMTALGPLEAMSAQQLLTGNALAQELADLKAALEAFSPPVTTPKAATEK